MSKHTPGPWFITGNMTLYVEARIEGGLIQEVASVGPTQADDGYGCQQRANANLIAAAPDLLEALEAICLMQARNYGDATQTHLDFPELAAKARAAIAKAKGEQQ